MQAISIYCVAKATARLLHLNLHAHGSTDPAQEQQQLDHNRSLGERAISPHLVNILKRVGLKDRMQSCALVSSSWSKAAVEATDSIISTNPL
jgi:hypothetical protein